MAELSEAINLDEIAVGSPRRIHDATARQVAEAPDRIATTGTLKRIRSYASEILGRFD